MGYVRLKDGGRLGPVHLYVERQADLVLQSALKHGRSCLLLGPRQTGKSSMLARAAAALSGPAFHFVSIDLDEVLEQPGMTGPRRTAANLAEREFYRELLTQMMAQLHISETLRNEFSEVLCTNIKTPYGILFFNRILQLLVERIPGRIVIGIDELERMLCWPGRNAFFDRLKSICDGALSEKIQFCLASSIPVHRLSECFVGIHLVMLEDFTRPQLDVFVPFLAHISERNRAALLDRIYDWTSGHPLWTHRICVYLQGSTDLLLPQAVDGIVRRRLLSLNEVPDPVLLEMERNIQILSPEDKAEILVLWKKLHAAGPEGFLLGSRAAVSRAQAERLRLLGFLRADDERVFIRNRIIAEFFDEEWATHALQSSSPPAASPSALPISQRAQIRRDLRKQLSDRESLAAFILDSFPQIYERCSAAMERIQLENLLLSTIPVDEIGQSLSCWLEEQLRDIA